MFALLPGAHFPWAFVAVYAVGLVAVLSIGFLALKKAKPPFP